MSRVRDLWFTSTAPKRKTARHPDNGGNKNAKRWLACWADPDGSAKTKAFATQAAANKFGKKMEADVDRGEYIDPRAGREKFGDLALKHLRLRDVGGTSRARYDSIYRNHVEPVFGHRAVKGIKPSEIVDWLRGDLASYSASVRSAAYFIAVGTFELAVADSMRRDNPARSPIVPVPAPDEGKPREPWDTPTVWRVIDELPEEYRAIAVCEAGMGLRQGCAFALAEDDFDFDTGKAVIRRQIVRLGGKFYFKLPKGDKERTVPVSRGVSAYVQAHMAKFPPRPYTLPWMDEHGKACEPVTARILFRWHGDHPSTRGGHIPAVSYNRSVWLPALSRAGIIPPPEKNKRGSLVCKSPDRKNGQHMLRHVFETTLDDGGVSLAGQMEFMGHSRRGQVITTAIYAHVTERTFERAREAVDATLFRLRPVASDGTVTELKAAR
jgi:integrase